jgi:hypothetical protein
MSSTAVTASVLTAESPRVERCGEIALAAAYVEHNTSVAHANSGECIKIGGLLELVALAYAMGCVGL